MAEFVRQEVQAGAVILVAGDEKSERVFIVEKGSVQLQSDHDQKNRIEHTANVGDVFGFMSALSGRARLETAIARENSALLAFHRDAFFARLQQNHKIAMRLIDIFGDVLEKFNDALFHPGSYEPHNLARRLMQSGRIYYRQKEYQTAAYIFKYILKNFGEDELAAQAKALFLKDKKLQNAAPKKPQEVENGLLYGKGEVVFCEHECGDRLFLIKKGKIEIEKCREDSSILLSVLNPGEIFGELALASERPRNATAVCSVESVLVPVTRDNLFTLFKDSPKVLKKIFSSICERIWFTYLRSSVRLFHKPLTRLYAFLEYKLLENRIPREQEGGHVFDFSIDSLLRMVGLTNPNENKEAVNKLLSDSNLSFNFGQIHVSNISALYARAAYLRRSDETGQQKS